MTDQQQRPRRARTGAGAVVLILIVALCLGGLTGAAVSGASSVTAEAPSELREAPSDFPGADQLYLPGITASDLEAWLSANEYQCEEVSDDSRDGLFGAAHWLKCTAPSSHGAWASVAVHYDDDTAVRRVSAKCERSPRTQPTYCPSVFSGTADWVFQSQPDLQKEAEAWGEDNVDNDAATVLGGIQMKTSLGQHTLDIFPAG